MTGVDLWTHADTVSMIPWAVAAGALILAALVSYRRWRPQPCTRCVQHAETILHLQEALDDARLTMLTRRHPPAAADVRTWAALRRTERPRRSWWPGDNSGQLQIIYGDPRDSERLYALAPADDLAWMWADDTTQSWPPLDREQLERLTTDLQEATA